MLMESFVAIMALTAACVLQPGLYFAMNSPAALIGKNAVDAAHVISSWGFAITPDMIASAAHEVGEKTVLSRVGGAPTLAVGMARILSDMVGGPGLAAFWYHFAILFEALFILTTIDAGTRVCRFMIQDFLGVFAPALRRTESWGANVLATALAVSGWGWFLYQGVVDPLGGINTLWPLFGIANQMLAAIALTLCTVVLFRMKRERYAWVTVVPTVWLLVCTLSAGWEKAFAADPKVGFLAHAQKFGAALGAGTILPPAYSLAEMHRVIFNDYLNTVLCCVFMAVVVAMVLFGLAAIRRALASPQATTRESPGLVEAHA
jgi:carbon starvation protein